MGKFFISLSFVHTVKKIKWEFCGRSQSTVVWNQFWRSTHNFFELSFSRLICDDYLQVLLLNLSFNSKVTFELFSYVDISIDKLRHLYQARCNCQKTLQKVQKQWWKKLTETNFMSWSGEEIKFHWKLPADSSI